MTPATCDACGPAVIARYVYYKGFDLLSFCGHHSRKHEDRLLLEGWGLLNDSEKVSETHSKS